MEQVYTPDIGVSAIPGYCLKYIDDAGKAPNRTATARYAWQMERDAGRISRDQIPENVWIVGFIDFTKGSYTTYGHVYFIKRNGNSYQIYDSEVQSGRRRPYGSLAELLGWFGAYGPIDLGWSTHCDGRQYAKKGGNTVKKMSKKDLEALYIAMKGTKADPKEIASYLDGSGNQTVKDFDVVFNEILYYFADRGLWYPTYKERMEPRIKQLEDRIKELEQSAEYEPIQAYAKKIKK